MSHLGEYFHALYDASSTCELKWNFIIFRGGSLLPAPATHRSGDHLFPVLVKGAAHRYFPLLGLFAFSILTSLPCSVPTCMAEAPSAEENPHRFGHQRRQFTQT